MKDHDYMLMCIPPKYGVSLVMGDIKRMSVIWIARNYYGRRQNYVRQQFWGRDFCVNTVGRDEKVIVE